MERQPDVDPIAAPKGPNTVAEPHAAAAPADPAVTLHLVSQPDTATCPFWIGLSTRGPLTPPALFAHADLGELLATAATTGIVESEPLMLSDAAAQPPLSVYLVPAPGESFRERAAWTVQLTQALRAWAPPVVGLAFVPAAAPTEQALVLMTEVLRAAIEGGMKATFHLDCGGHGINSVLNAALKLKAELGGEGHSVYVYH